MIWKNISKHGTQKTRVTAVRYFQTLGTGYIVFDRAQCEDFLATISETVSLICLIGEENLMIGWNYSTMWVMVMAGWARVQELL